MTSCFVSWKVGCFWVGSSGVAGGFCVLSVCVCVCGSSGIAGGLCVCVCVCVSSHPLPISCSLQGLSRGIMCNLQESKARV